MQLKKQEEGEIAQGLRHAGNHDLIPSTTNGLWCQSTEPGKSPEYHWVLPRNKKQKILKTKRNKEHYISHPVLGQV